MKLEIAKLTASTVLPLQVPKDPTIGNVHPGLRPDAQPLTYEILYACCRYGVTEHGHVFRLTRAGAKRVIDSTAQRVLDAMHAELDEMIAATEGDTDPHDEWPADYDVDGEC